MKCYNQAPEWLLLNPGLLRKSVTSVQPLPWSFCGFVTVGPGGKETREREQEERKSDLGEEEEEEISGEIKVKSSLHDHSEMSAPHKTHSQPDSPVRTREIRTRAHAIIRNIHKQDDWWMHTLTGIWGHMGSNIHMDTQSEERGSKGPCRLGLYLCSLPIPTHSQPPPPPPPAYSQSRTHSLCPTPWKTLISAPMCRDHSREKKGRVGKHGVERISPCCCPARAPPHNCQSWAASPVHGHRTNAPSEFF